MQRVKDRDHVRKLTRESEEKARLEFAHAKTTRPFPELEEVITETYAGDVDKPKNEVPCPWVTGNGAAGTLDVQHRDILAVIFELINAITNTRKREGDLEHQVTYLAVWKCVLAKLFPKNVIAGGTQGHQKVVEHLHHRTDVTLAWLYKSGVVRGVRGAKEFVVRELPIKPKPAPPHESAKDSSTEDIVLPDVLAMGKEHDELSNLEGSGIA